MTTAFSDPTLRQAVASSLADVAPNAILTAAADPAVIAADHWKLAVEMGWTAAFIEEAHGGLGLSLPQMADICEEMGRNLFCGPYAETAVFLPAIAREAEGALDDLLPRIASGEAHIAYAEVDLEVSAAARWSVELAEHVSPATHLLLIDQKSNDGLVCLVVDLQGAAVERRLPMDSTASVGRFELGQGNLRRHMEFDPDAGRRISRTMDLAVAADLLGCGEAALARAVDHASTRRQFGSPIGAFQAIKHRLADCHVGMSCARLAITAAVRDEADAGAAELARILAAEAALRATSAAIQIHGGSGFSWEVDLHLYFKRTHRLAARNGGATCLRAATTDRFIRQVLAQAA
jgi:alkylation response protein AidB-like acyl-CoA dehydrogenase